MYPITGTTPNSGRLIEGETIHVYGIGYIKRSLEKTRPLYLVFTLSSIALNVTWWELNENVHYTCIL